MAHTTEEYLTSLVSLKGNLASNLVTKGVSASDAELFESLIPKILDIQNGYDTSKVTAGAGDVLAGKVIVDANGKAISGTMANKGAWTGKTSGNGNVIIPAGYHNGSGYVSGADSYNSGYNQGVIDGRSGYYTKAQYDANYTAGYNAGYAAGRTQGQNDVKGSPNSYGLYSADQYNANYNNGRAQGQNDVKNSPGSYGLGKVASGSFTGNQTINLGWKPSAVAIISKNGSNYVCAIIYHPSVGCHGFNSGGSHLTAPLTITSSGFSYSNGNSSAGSFNNYYFAMA